MLLKTFQRGIHPSYHKDLTSDKAIENALLPKRVVIPLWQHIGAPCEPLVKKGDDVTEGQKIGDAKSFVSAPVHASITGKVKEVTMHSHPAGAKALSIIIEGDGVTRKDWTEAEAVDPEKLSPDEIRTLTKEAGIVGLGGAAVGGIQILFFSVSKESLPATTPLYSFSDSNIDLDNYGDSILNYWEISILSPN